MLDWIRKKLEQLLDTLVDPFWRWCLALPWVGRLAVLMCAIAAISIGLYWKQTLSHLNTGVHIYQVLANEDHQGIPLSRSYKKSVAETAGRLAFNLQADIVSRGQPGHESWATSQTVVALEDVSQLPSKELAEFFRSQVDPGCSCWKEFPRPGAPRHVVATSWVLFALARLQSSVPSSEIGFLLKHQSKEGWWPIFPSPERLEYASTYATAWSLLALNEHLGRNLLSQQQTAPVIDAIARGRSWLTSRRIPGQSRWKDYPASVTGKISESLSGLVMFVLHRLNEKSMIDLDQQWLDTLPSTPPPADFCEIPLLWTNTSDGRQLDAYCQLRLPWLLMGTMDAYHSGTLLQKAKTIDWIERALDQTNVYHSDTFPENWQRAEVLISLKRLLHGYEGTK